MSRLLGSMACGLLGLVIAFPQAAEAKGLSGGHRGGGHHVSSGHRGGRHHAAQVSHRSSKSRRNHLSGQSFGSKRFTGNAKGHRHHHRHHHHRGLAMNGQGFGGTSLGNSAIGGAGLGNAKAKPGKFVGQSGKKFAGAGGKTAKTK
jgi:hypothetical protein